MIRFAENLNKMITAGLGGALEAPSTEVAVGHRVRYMDASGPVATFNTNITAPIRSLRVDMQPIQAGSGDPSPDNVRPITGRTAVTVWREAVYDPSADPVLNIQLGQTVYGGTVDVTGGKVHVTHELVDMSTFNWSPYADSNPYVGSAYCYFESTNYILPEVDDTAIMSNVFKNLGRTGARDTLFSFGFVLPHPYIWLRIYDGEYHTRAEWQAKLAEMGAKVVLPLAEPFDIDITPAQLATLAGENKVWSDAGDVTLEYPYYEETEGY